MAQFELSDELFVQNVNQNSISIDEESPGVFFLNIKLQINAEQESSATDPVIREKDKNMFRWTVPGTPNMLVNAAVRNTVEIRKAKARVHGRRSVLRVVAEIDPKVPHTGSGLIAEEELNGNSGHSKLS